MIDRYEIEADFQQFGSVKKYTFEQSSRRIEGQMQQSNR